MPRATQADRDLSPLATASVGVASLSETKPLHWSSFLTVPIAALAIWGVVFACACSQRAQLVNELAKTIASGTEDEAVAALEQLTRLPDPPLEILVEAAASPTRRVAVQAQDSIAELLRRWRSQLNASRGASRVSAHVEQLAAALDAEGDAIAAFDSPWLAKTTERILRLANSAPSEDALDLALHCESLFAVATARTIDPSRQVVPAASAMVEQIPDAVFNPPSRLALQSIVPDAIALEVSVEPTPEPPTAVTKLPNAPLRWSRPGSSFQALRPRPLEFRQTRELKTATPIPVADVTPPAAILPDPWEMIDSRSLLARWLAATGDSKQLIESELFRRGFGNLRSDLVRLALSRDRTGRVQLVDDLLATPGVGGKAWLLLLADDDDAEVRLAAVTVMVTSNDRQLLEKAWQVALHDQDPRIASLAQRLRDRHALPEWR
jgi:hypothetical protein